MAQQEQSQHPGTVDGYDVNIVEKWLRVDPARWIAGVLGGAVAALIALAVAGMLAKSAGFEIIFPIKLMATPFLGGPATELGAPMISLVLGLVFSLGVGSFWGFVYSHFVYSNTFWVRLVMGAVWGTYLWIFNWNLMFQSFLGIKASGTPPSAAFLICMVYGLSLVTVGVFDSIFRAAKSK